jgi:hypothetical protein
LKNFSVLQRVRGSATIGLCYVNPTTLARTTSTETETAPQNGPQNEVKYYFQVIKKRVFCYIAWFRND